MIKVLIASILISLTAIAANASLGCRDCPFPMGIGPGRWLMPGKLSELVVLEAPVSGRRVRTTVQLIVANTGDKIAEGSMVHGKTVRFLKLQLVDNLGGIMEAELYFSTETRETVQVRIICTRCNLHPSLYN